jgi:hypothetical protein
MGPEPFYRDDVGEEPLPSALCVRDFQRLTLPFFVQRRPALHLCPTIEGNEHA